MKQIFKVPGAPVSKNGDKTRYVKYGRSDPRRKPYYDHEKKKMVQRDGFISHYTDKEVIEYSKKVEKCIISSKPAKYSGAVAVHIFVSVKPPKSMKGTRLKMITPNMLDKDERRIIMPTSKPDNDNLEKNILDAVKKHCFIDDSYICDNSTRKRFGDEDYVIIEVEEIGIPCQWSVGEIKEYINELEEENVKNK